MEKENVKQPAEAGTSANFGAAPRLFNHGFEARSLRAMTRMPGKERRGANDPEQQER
jgi:hypothetical protein